MDKSIQILSSRQIAALLHQHRQLTNEVTIKQKKLEELSDKINSCITNLETHYYGSPKKSETK